jgi:hypothetical protein
MRHKKLKEFNTRGFAPNSDTRTGMGYGKTSSPNGSGTSFMKNSEYPYVESDDYSCECECEDDCNCDDDLYYSKAFLTKIGANTYHNNHGVRNDKGSFVKGRGLGENFAGNSISPIPNLYKNRQTATGGAPPSGIQTAPLKRIGSKRGWFSAPPNNYFDDNLYVFIKSANENFEETPDDFLDIFDEYFSSKSEE